MKAFDKLALWGRRYEPQVNLRTGENRFSLRDLLEAFRTNTILELTPIAGGEVGTTYKPDPIRKLKISILDEGVSALGTDPVSWYEIHATAPSGDLARVRVLAYGPNGRQTGELQMLIAQRMPDLYFQEDPIFSSALDKDRR